jgi:streptogramin lyase
MSFFRPGAVNLDPVLHVGQSVNPRSRIWGALIALVALVLLPASASAAPAVSGEFAVPGLREANEKIVEGPDKNIWVTIAEGGKDVARITPSGQVTELEVNGVTAPSGIAVGPEGKLWVTQEGGVASFLPSSPQTAVATPIPAIKDGASIVAGPDGEIWVATPEAVSGDGEVIRFSPTAPQLATKVPVTPKLAPHDIDVAGSLIAIASAGVPRIVTLTTAGVEKDYAIPGGSQGVAANRAGTIAFSQPGMEPEQVGLIAPPGPASLINLPGAGDPFGVALGADESFWAVLFTKDGVERLTPSGQIGFLGGLKKGAMARQIASGPGNTLWVTETEPGGEGVARISGVEPPSTKPPTNPPPPGRVPRTKILSGPHRFVFNHARRPRVSFRFSSPDAGASFECRLERLGRGATRPPFAPCASPSAYRVRPGHYRFEVRAVLAGVADPSPAKRGFEAFHLGSAHRR